MWSFSYTKCKRIVCRTKIYFTQHQHIVKRVHHLKKNQQNNRQNNKILTNRAKAHKHTQPNNLHIERAQANLTNTHILATHREFMNLHTNRETVNFYSKLYSTTHTMNKRISIFVASAFEENKTLNQTKSYPKTSFCINNTHTHTTKYKYYTEFFRRACSSANREKKGTNIKPGSSFCIILTIPLTTTTTTTEYVM